MTVKCEPLLVCVCVCVRVPCVCRDTHTTIQSQLVPYYGTGLYHNMVLYGYMILYHMLPYCTVLYCMVQW